MHRLRHMQGLPTLSAIIAMAGLALAGLATAAPTRAREGAHASVIGGKTAPLGQFPWMAHIEYEVATGEWICSGTVIAPRVVLTAAHCAEDPEYDSLAPASTYQVITGVADVDDATPTNFSAVAEVVVDPRFQPLTLENDAGLLILKKPVQAPAIALASPPAGHLLATGTPVSVAGWGVVDPDSIRAATAFHVGNGEVASSSACTYDEVDPAVQLCATGAPGFHSIACYGDSGGPAIARRADGTRVEIGIFSLVSSTLCDPHRGDVYTRVDRLSGWAQRWIAAVEVEGGGPRPPAREQHPVLPFLTAFRAKQIAAEKLAEQLPIDLVGPSKGDFTCRRLTPSKVSCRGSWIREHNYLYGNVDVYFRIRDREVAWNDRFQIHWVSRTCQAGPNPMRCPVHTLEGPSGRDRPYRLWEDAHR